MVRQHHQLNGHEFEQTLGSGRRQRTPVRCSPWGHKESDMTEWLNKNNYMYILCVFVSSSSNNDPELFESTGTGVLKPSLVKRKLSCFSERGFQPTLLFCRWRTSEAEKSGACLELQKFINRLPLSLYMLIKTWICF